MADEKKIYTSEYAIADLDLYTSIDGFDIEDEAYMWGVYWNGLHNLKPSNLELPKGKNWEECMRYGIDTVRISSDYILEHKPDDVDLITVIYQDYFHQGFILQYGNWNDGKWEKIGITGGFA